MKFDDLPDNALIRQHHLVGRRPSKSSRRKSSGPRSAGILPFSEATLWRRVKAGAFPKPIKLPDGNITAWRVGEVRAWMAEQGQCS